MHHPARSPQHREAGERPGNSGTDLEEQALERSREGEGGGEAEGETEANQPEPLEGDGARDVAGGGPERDPQADLAAALRYAVGEHAVDPDDGERQGGAAEGRDEDQGANLRPATEVDLLEGAHAGRHVGRERALR